MLQVNSCFVYPLKVPYSAMGGMSSKIIPKVREAFEAVEKFHLVSSYGIPHRMIPPAGRPEIVLEGSMDKKTWKVRTDITHGLWKENMDAKNLFRLHITST